MFSGNLLAVGVFVLFLLPLPLCKLPLAFLALIAGDGYPAKGIWR